MAKWYFDTSVLVAAAVGRHVHNSRAVSVIDALIAGKHRGYVSTHGLTEVYSVLTRAPFRPPIFPGGALQVIEDHILRHMDLVSLDTEEYVDLVRRAAQEGWIGGRIHDAVHLRCATKMRCDRIYTFNLKDFRQIAPGNLADRISLP